MFAVFLRHMFLSTAGLSTAGIAVEIDGIPTLLFASLKILISDGDGLRMSFGWKGAAGLKPCLKHGNVLQKNSDMV